MKVQSTNELSNNRFDHYVLDIEVLDSQHKQMAEDIETLKISMRLKHFDKCKRDISKLAEDTKLHFEYEEAVMDSICYPFKAFHKTEHQRLLVILDTLIKLDTINLKSDLTSSLETVVFEHIDTYDRQLARYINGHE